MKPASIAFALARTLALSSLLLTGGLSQVAAEQASVPHEFRAGDPAKSSEVNENFGAILEAIGRITSLHLYQDGAHKGRSVLLNVMLLDSGYATLVFQEPGNPVVYLIEHGSLGAWYASNDCSGQGYVRDPVLEFDTGSGEQGYLVQFDSTPIAALVGLPNTRQGVNLQSAISNGGYPFYREILDPEFGYVVAWEYTPAGECHTFDAPIFEQGAIPFSPNDPAITGIRTESCTRDGNAAICLPNAEIRRE